MKNIIDLPETFEIVDGDTVLPICDAPIGSFSLKNKISISKITDCIIESLKKNPQVVMFITPEYIQFRLKDSM
jgi:hypothetical protein